MDSGRLVLTVTDTLQRYYRPNLFAPGKYTRMGDRSLLGWYRNERMRYADTAWVQHDTLHTGCLPGQMTDCGSWHYRIEAIYPAGFWGHWEDPQEGLGRLIDSAGNWAPNPAGYFCARRLSAR